MDENGAAIILKNNVPRYLVLEFSQAEQEEKTDDESLRAISQRLIAKNRKAYEELAKMKFLSLEQVLKLHDDLIETFGGAPEIHDLGPAGIGVGRPVPDLWRGGLVPIPAGEGGPAGVRHRIKPRFRGWNKRTRAT